MMYYLYIITHSLWRLMRPLLTLTIPRAALCVCWTVCIQVRELYCRGSHRLTSFPSCSFIVFNAIFIHIFFSLSLLHSPTTWSIFFDSLFSFLYPLSDLFFPVSRNCSVSVLSNAFKNFPAWSSLWLLWSPFLQLPYLRRSLCYPPVYLLLHIYVSPSGLTYLMMPSVNKFNASCKYFFFLISFLSIYLRQVWFCHILYRLNSSPDLVFWWQAGC